MKTYPSSVLFPTKNQINFGQSFVLLAFGLFFCQNSFQAIGQETPKEKIPAGLFGKEIPEKGENQLKPNNYRLIIEPILEPINNKFAIYRVIILTKDKVKITLDYEGGQFSQDGFSIPELGKGAKTYRTDFILVACLKEPQELQKQKGIHQLVFFCLVRGASGMTFFGKEEKPPVQLNKILEIPSSESFQERGKKSLLADFLEKSLKYMFIDSIDL